MDQPHYERQIWLSPDMACRLAAIDIGSNSVRLFVAEALSGGAYRILDEEREPTRLGRSVSSLGRLDDESMEKTLREGGQVLLLLNRRGYANYIACSDPRCEWMLTCTECALHQFVRICNVRAESLAPCSNLRKDRALIGGGWVVCADRVQECTLLWKRT